VRRGPRAGAYRKAYRHAEFDWGRLPSRIPHPLSNSPTSLPLIVYGRIRHYFFGLCYTKGHTQHIFTQEFHPLTLTVERLEIREK
jgi:hypothetical protein